MSQGSIARGFRLFWHASIFLAVVVVTWPNPPWLWLQYGGIALMVLAPIGFFPFSKTLFLAFDLVFRPPTREELS